MIYICFALLVLFNMLLAMVLDSYGAAAQVLHKRADAPTIITQRPAMKSPVKTIKIHQNPIKFIRNSLKVQSK